MSILEPVGLNIRQHARHALTLDAIVRVAPECDAAVRFSPQAGVSERGFVCRVSDLGLGGMGLLSNLFVPRRTVLVVSLLNRGGTMSKPLLEAEVRVQRVSTFDRAPTFALGTAFTDRSAGMQERVTEILSRLDPSAREGAGA